METSELAALYEVALDTEADVLDALRVRAGLIWNCSACTGWANPSDRPTCENCGSRRPQDVDPDETLQELRNGIRRLRDAARGDSNDREIELAHELADTAEALDNWMSSGGFLPADWARREAS